MTKDEALRMALKALVTLSEQSDCDIDSFTFGRFGGNTAITAIKEVLAQPAPPPECKTVAEQTAYAFGWWKALETVRTEQPAQEQPLTDEKLIEMFGNGPNGKVFQQVARLIEAAHNIGAKP